MSVNLARVLGRYSRFNVEKNKFLYAELWSGGIAKFVFVGTMKPSNRGPWRC